MPNRFAVDWHRVMWAALGAALAWLVVAVWVAA